MANALNWFEIPASDYERAKGFYEALLLAPLQPMPAEGRRMAAFPADWTKRELGGCIVQDPHSTPSASGTIAFLNCDPDLSSALARVEKVGGKVLVPKTQIPMQGAGYVAIIMDSEGNRVGMHSSG